MELGNGYAARNRGNRMVGRVAVTGGFGLLLVLYASVGLPQSVVPSSYHAVSNRNVYPKAAAPSLGPAGHRFVDPTFGSRLLRVTDASTRPNDPGRSYSTPSASHQLAWNATSDRFYIRSLSGWFIPYDFNPATMTATRIQPSTTGNGGLLIASQVEPQFSFVSRDIIYGTTRDQTVPVGSGDFPVVHKYDFAKNQYTELLSLRTVTPLDPDTYTGALSSSATAPEKVSVLFGGCCQDSHFKVAVFEAASPANSVIILDTLASTVRRGGVTRAVSALGFRLHHAWIDQTGRWVVLYPVSATPVHFMIWDLAGDTFTPVTTRPWGHDALGYGWQVNQDCCASGASYDGAQWQLRALSNPQASADLIAPPLSPQQIYLADHTSWNNAQPDRRVPILSSLYRYYNNSYNTAPWRPWDDEIVAIRTDGAESRVWRFAHHRSNITADPHPWVPEDGTYFWYQPHANISPNGRWALFTSNWEKTLGAAAGGGEPGGIYRTDVFVVALTAGRFADDPLIPNVTPVRAVHLTELRARIDILRATYGLQPFGWTDPALGPGILVKALHLTEMRQALQAAYTAAGRGAEFFIPTDPVVTPTATPIRATHIQELRQAVVTLEGG